MPESLALSLVLAVWQVLSKIGVNLVEVPQRCLQIHDSKIVESSFCMGHDVRGTSNDCRLTCLHRHHHLFIGEGIWFSSGGVGAVVGSSLHSTSVWGVAIGVTSIDRKCRVPCMESAVVMSLGSQHHCNLKEVTDPLHQNSIHHTLLNSFLARLDRVPTIASSNSVLDGVFDVARSSIIVNEEVTPGKLHLRAVVQVVQGSAFNIRDALEACGGVHIVHLVDLSFVQQILDHADTKGEVHKRVDNRLDVVGLPSQLHICSLGLHALNGICAFEYTNGVGGHTSWEVVHHNVKPCAVVAHTARR
mmetsp:Transcript_37957/g.45768  ORF Transcript_37957/g.45768 Transcript_37957/m.45768 type:complete len:303 (-) Transcript_37957:999-1907(-)